MAIWDDIKSAVSTVYQAGAAAVGKLKEEVSEAWDTVKEWVQPYAALGTDDAYAAAVQAMNAAQAAVRQQFEDQQALFDRAQASQNVRDAADRARATVERVTSIDTAATKATQAIEKAREVSALISEHNEKIKRLAAERKARLEADAAKVAEIPRVAQTLADSLERNALDVLTGKMTLLEKFSPRAQKLLDENIPGFRELPADKADIMLSVIPIGKVAKAGNVVNRIAAHRIGEVLQKKGVAKFWEQYAKDPKSTVAMIAKLKPEDSVTFWKQLEKTPRGVKAVKDIAKVQADKVIIVMKEEQKAGWKKVVRDAPGPLLKVLGLIVGTLGLGFAAAWLRKEAPEPLGIAAWGAYEDKNWEELEKLATNYKSLLNKMDEEVASEIIEKFPLIGEYFKANMDAQHKTADFYLKTAREKQESDEPTWAEVYLDTKQEAADIYLAARREAYKPYTPYRVQGGRTYNYTASAPGFKSISGSFYARPYTRTTEPIDLEAGEEAPGQVHTSSVPEAEIWMGGIDTGFTTPHTFELPPGTYDLRFEAKGHRPEVRTATVWAGEEKTLDVILETEWTDRDLSTGYVSFDTVPMGAYVFINGAVQDWPTPTKVDLDPGEYAIIIKKTGYEDVEDTVTVEAGQTYIKMYELVEKVEPDVWRVHVSSEPAGAKILVDDFFTGAWTPGYVDLLTGAYVIGVQKTGFEQAEEVIDVG